MAEAKDELLPVYSTLHAALVTAENRDAALTFDYEDEAGNKKARSHVHTLRGERAAVDKARKAEKAESLEYGRKVDAQARSIMEHYTALIERHTAPLQEIEDRESNRVAKLQMDLDDLRELGTLSNEETTLEELRRRLEQLQRLEVDDTWQEYMADAYLARDNGIKVLEQEIKRLEKHLADMAELEELRKIQDEQDRIARDNQIREQAARDAEAETKRREEAAAQEVRDAFAREEQRKADELAEQERLDREEAELEAKRQADVEHRGQIQHEIQVALEDIISRAPDGCTGAHLANLILEELVVELIPHVTISYAAER